MPVCIIGANIAYPPKRFLIKRVPITVIVGKAFVIQENETDEVFKVRVHDWFVEQQSEYQEVI